MKKLFPLLILLLLFSRCTELANPVTNADTLAGQKSKLQPNTDTLVVPKNKPQLIFPSCFDGIDTTQKCEAVACVGMVYLIVGDKYVVHISPKAGVQHDSCFVVQVDSTQNEPEAELWIYKNKQANLSNLCTDFFDLNIPQPIRELSAIGGEFFVAYPKAKDVPTFSSSVFIKELVFYGNKTGERIVIKNKLAWRVVNFMTPG